MTSYHSSVPSCLLRHFVADGLRDTVHAYTAGTLPLHRFAWELDARLSTLTELTIRSHYRILTSLRDAQDAVATIDAALRGTAREGLTAAEEHTLAVAVTTLRTGLSRLDPPDPIDPIDPGQPRPGPMTDPRRDGVRRAHLTLVA